MQLLYADAKGVLYEDPEYQAAGADGAGKTVRLTGRNTIPLPEGADLMLLPGMAPVGWDRWGKRPVRDIKRVRGGERLYAVAAILPAGYTRTLLPAYRPHGPADMLGLFGYTAAAGRDGDLFVAAVQTDESYKWNPLLYNDLTLPGRIEAKRNEWPGNRLVEHLAHCAAEYHCLTAQNIFYERWEGGIPVSPGCNAGCLGCISLQPSECCPSPQARIDFVPTVAEVAGLAAAHLERGAEPIISFGQGCEGEPLLEADLIAAAITGVRRRTSRGVLNINTNAGHTAGLEKLCAAGLGAVRVSLLSARPAVYAAYHRPRGFDLGDVRRSLALARERGRTVSLNLLVMPGFTDRVEETAALLELLGEGWVDMVQLRNLNIDPYHFFRALPPAEGAVHGIPKLIALIRDAGVRVGNYTRYGGEGEGR